MGVAGAAIGAGTMGVGMAAGTEMKKNNSFDPLLGLGFTIH
jgi:hypothetical protein